LGSDTDVDIFRVNLEAGTEYEFSASIAARTLFESELEFRLIDAAGNDLGATVERLNHTIRLSYESGSDQAAYLKVSGGEPNSYTFQGRKSEAAEPDPWDASLDDYANWYGSTKNPIGQFSNSSTATVSGTINHDLDQDYFKITLDHRYEYDFRVLSPSGEGIEFDIRDHRGRLIENSRESSRDSIRDFDPEESGTYYVSVSSREGVGEGQQYTIQAKRTATGRLDDSIADDIEGAQSISIGQTLTSAIDYSRDTDWIKISLGSSGQEKLYSLNLSAIGASVLMDYELYSADGIRIDDDLDFFDKIDAGSSASGNIRVTGQQDFYLELGSDSSTVGGYSLSVNEVSTTDVLASTLTTASMSTVTQCGTTVYDGTFNARIEQAGDSDWIAVNLAAGSTNGKVWSYYLDDSFGDVEFSFRDSRGNLLSDTISPTENDAATPLYNAEYFVEVSSNTVQSYVVEAVRYLDDVSNNISTAKSLGALSTNPSGLSYNGNIENKQDVDYFTLQLVEGQSITIDLFELDANGEITLSGFEIFDRNLTRVMDSDHNDLDRHFLDDSGFFTTSYTGTYYVAVANSREWESTPYRLEVKNLETSDAYADDIVSAKSQPRLVLDDGDEFRDQFNYAGDSDLLRVWLTQGSVYDFNIDTELFEGGVRILDSSGNLVTSGVEFGDLEELENYKRGLERSVDYRHFGQTGEYFIQLDGYSRVAGSQATADSWELEVNVESSVSSQVLTPRSDLSFNVTDDFDARYEIDVRDGYGVIISIDSYRETNSSANFDGRNFNIDFGSYQTVSDYDYQYPENIPSEFLVINQGQEGNGVLRIRERNSGEIGNQRIHVSSEFEVDTVGRAHFDTLDDGTLFREDASSDLEINLQKKSFIYESGEVDSYKFELDAGVYALIFEGSSFIQSGNLDRTSYQSVAEGNSGVSGSLRIDYDALSVDSISAVFRDAFFTSLSALEGDALEPFVNLVDFNGSKGAYVFHVGSSGEYFVDLSSQELGGYIFSLQELSAQNVDVDDAGNGISSARTVSLDTVDGVTRLSGSYENYNDVDFLEIDVTAGQVLAFDGYVGSIAFYDADWLTISNGVDSDFTVLSNGVQAHKDEKLYVKLSASETIYNQETDYAQNYELNIFSASQQDGILLDGKVAAFSEISINEDSSVIAISGLSVDAKFGEFTISVDQVPFGGVFNLIGNGQQVSSGMKIKVSNGKVVEVGGEAVAAFDLDVNGNWFNFMPNADFSGLGGALKLSATDVFGNTAIWHQSVNVLAAPDAPVVNLKSGGKVDLNLSDGQMKLDAADIVDADDDIERFEIIRLPDSVADLTLGFTNADKVEDLALSVGDSYEFSLFSQLVLTPKSSDNSINSLGSSSEFLEIRIFDKSNNFADLSLEIAPNTAPTTRADRFEVVNDRVLTLAASDILGNDIDLEGDEFSIKSVDGLAVLNNDQTVSFTPPSGFTGTTSFNYTVVDQRGAESSGNVRVFVQPPEDSTANHEIRGDDEADDLRGSLGDDSLYGAKGDDTLRGGAGNDRIDGGEGSDQVYGDDGVDTYIFHGASEALVVEYINENTYRVGEAQGSSSSSSIQLASADTVSEWDYLYDMEQAEVEGQIISLSQFDPADPTPTPNPGDGGDGGGSSGGDALGFLLAGAAFYFGFFA